MRDISYRSYGIGLAIGLILGYLLGHFRVYEFILNVIPRMTLDFAWIEAAFTYSLKSDFLSDLAAFEGVLIGVAIPIALQVVTRTAERYGDYEIAQFFTDERLYRSQYFLLLPNIAIAIFFRLLDVSNSLILWPIFIWLLANIFIFYRFVRLVEDYTTSTDKLLLRKLDEYVETIFQK